MGKKDTGREKQHAGLVRAKILEYLAELKDGRKVDAAVIRFDLVYDFPAGISDKEVSSGLAWAKNYGYVDFSYCKLQEDDLFFISERGRDYVEARNV